MPFPVPAKLRQMAEAPKQAITIAIMALAVAITGLMVAIFNAR